MDKAGSISTEESDVEMYCIRQVNDMANKCTIYQQLVLKITADLQQKRMDWETKLKDAAEASEEKFVAVTMILESTMEEKEKAIGQACELQMQLNGALEEIESIKKKFTSEAAEKAILLEANTAMKQVLEDSHTQLEATRSDLKQKKEGWAAEKNLLREAHVELQQRLEEMRVLTTSQTSEFILKEALLMDEKVSWGKEKAAVVEENNILKRHLGDIQAELKKDAAGWLAEKASWLVEKAAWIDSKAKAKEKIHSADLIHTNHVATQCFDSEHEKALWMSEKAALVEANEEMKRQLKESNVQLDRQIEDAQIQLDKKSLNFQSAAAAWANEKISLMKSGAETEQQRVTDSKARLLQLIGDAKLEMGRKEALWAVEESSLMESNQDLKNQLDDLRTELTRRSDYNHTTRSAWLSEKVAMQVQLEQQQHELQSLNAGLLDAQLSSEKECTTINHQLGELQAQMTYSLDMAQSELDITVEVLEEQQASATSELEKEMGESLFKLKEEHKLTQIKLEADHAVQTKVLHTTIELMQQQISEKATMVKSLDEKLQALWTVQETLQEQVTERIDLEHHLREKLKQMYQNQQKLMDQIETICVVENQMNLEMSKLVDQALQDDKYKKTLQVELEERVTLIGAATHELGVVQELNSQLKARLRELQEELDVSNSFHHEMKSNTSVLNGRLLEMSTLETELRDELEGAVTLELEMVAVDRELRARISELEGVEMELREQIVQMDRVMDVHREQIKEQGDNDQDSQQRIEELEEATKMLRSEVDSRQLQLDAEREGSTRLSDKCVALEQDLESSRAAWALAEAERESQEQVSVKLQGDVEDGKNEIVRLRGQSKKDIDVLAEQLALCQLSLESSQSASALIKTQMEQAQREAEIQERAHRQILIDFEQRAGALLATHVEGATLREEASKREMSLLESQLEAALNALEQHIVVEASRQKLHGSELERLMNLMTQRDSQGTTHAFKSGASLMCCRSNYVLNGAALASCVGQWRIRTLQASTSTIETTSHPSEEESDETEDSLDFRSMSNSPPVLSDVEEIHFGLIDVPDALSFSVDSTLPSHTNPCIELGDEINTAAALSSLPPQQQEAPLRTPALEEDPGKHRRRGMFHSPKLSELVGERPQLRGRRRSVPQ